MRRRGGCVESDRGRPAGLWAMIVFLPRLKALTPVSDGWMELPPMEMARRWERASLWRVHGWMSSWLTFLFAGDLDVSCIV